MGQRTEEGRSDAHTEVESGHVALCSSTFKWISNTHTSYKELALFTVTAWMDKSVIRTII